jgi:predicted nucleic acid-binding protein
MKVLVDTSVWSLALRRSRTQPKDTTVAELRLLVEEGRVAILGEIRQELLSGVKQQQAFQVLREHLRAFLDEPLGSEDFEYAAECFNLCRAKGVQGSNTDFLICSVSALRAMPIFTTDKDFTQYQRILPISLHTPR